VLCSASFCSIAVDRPAGGTRKHVDSRKKGEFSQGNSTRVDLISTRNALARGGGGEGRLVSWELKVAGGANRE
jgi:hypothetical protein